MSIHDCTNMIQHPSIAINAMTSTLGGSVMVLWWTTWQADEEQEQEQPPNPTPPHPAQLTPDCRSPDSSFCWTSDTQWQSASVAANDSGSERLDILRGTLRGTLRSILRATTTMLPPLLLLLKSSTQWIPRTDLEVVRGLLLLLLRLPLLLLLQQRSSMSLPLAPTNSSPWPWGASECLGFATTSSSLYSSTNSRGCGRRRICCWSTSAWVTCWCPCSASTWRLFRALKAGGSGARRRAPGMDSATAYLVKY